MPTRNPNYSSFSGSYLFQEIAKRKAQYLKVNPGADLLNLGIGDTTTPLPNTITNALSKYALGLGNHKGYSGYGSSEGWETLRISIANEVYKNSVSSDEVFVSDGSKCDIGRLQLLFNHVDSIAVQNPTYPVYVEGSILNGINPDRIFKMDCLPEEGFMPKLVKADLIYICSPNNPTGASLTRDQLTEVVHFAKENGSIIIFDSAYSAYIQDPLIPKSIYEIEGADEVAIESGSFSKMAGFTGVRLGWTVVPKALKYTSGESVRDDWMRLISTVFNGASNVAQAGGLACLSQEGKKTLGETVTNISGAASEAVKKLKDQGFEVFGGENAPYLWIRIPGQSSWEVFTHLLENAQIVSIPGVGFGSAGEGFVRFSAFAGKEMLLKACSRLESITLVNK